MKLLRTEVNKVAQVLGKKCTNFWLLNVVYVYVRFFLKHCYKYRSKWTEAVRFHTLAAGVEAEQDCNPFVQRFLSSCACLIELKT